MAGIGFIAGSKKIAVLADWYNVTNQAIHFIPDSVELILAIGLKTNPAYKDKESILLEKGFKKNEKTFRNPQTGSSLTFFAGFVEELDSIFIQKSQGWQPSAQGVRNSGQVAGFPSCCGMRVASHAINYLQKYSEVPRHLIPLDRVGCIYTAINQDEANWYRQHPNHFSEIIDFGSEVTFYSGAH